MEYANILPLICIYKFYYLRFIIITYINWRPGCFAVAWCYLPYSESYEGGHFQRWALPAPRQGEPDSDSEPS